MQRTGFIGLGDMGGAIARRIIEAGFDTALWARRPESYEQFAGLAFRRAATPRELAAGCDIVGVCVFADADVRAVALGEDGVLAGMRPGGVLLVHSTISVEGAEELAAAGEARGVHVLDAPVSGARSGAAAGRLAIMAGGARAGFDAALPLMRCYGGNIVYTGPSGSGQKLKVLNNVLGFANLQMAHIALELGERLGLEKEAVHTVLRSGSGGSFVLNILLDRLLPDPAFARHAVTMTEKDTRLFQRVCRAAGIETTRMEQVAEEAIEMVGQLGRR